jgi:hypothetical protein
MRNNYFQQLKEVEKNFLKQLWQQLFVFLAPIIIWLFLRL